MRNGTTIRVVTGCPCGHDIIELVNESGMIELSGFADNIDGQTMFARCAGCSTLAIERAPRITYEKSEAERAERERAGAIADDRRYHGEACDTSFRGES